MIVPNHPHGDAICKRGYRGGLTLLEVLIAMAILTFGLMGLLVTLQKTLQKSEPIEFEARAALLAESIVEGIRSHPEGIFPFIPGLNPKTWPVLPRGASPYAEGILTNQDGTPYRVTENTEGMILPFVFSLPGNGLDDDALVPDGQRNAGQDPSWIDEWLYDFGNPFEPQEQRGTDGIDDNMYRILIGNGILINADGSFSPLASSSLRDFDGSIEEDVRQSLAESSTFPTGPLSDTDGDGLPDDSGDSFIPSQNPQAAMLDGVLQDRNLFPRLTDPPHFRPDGDFAYDPQRGIDEEITDGKDNDGDGLIDEDTKLASQQRPGLTQASAFPNDYLPWLAGNGLDDDGDSEDFQDLNGNGVPDRGEPGVDLLTGLVMADLIDNNGNGQVDEGIDEELFDGTDTAEDGSIDEDCRAAVFPWNPIPFPSPNEDYSFQISVRRIQAVGDEIDNDSDGLTDEEALDRIDNDADGLIDEDTPIAAPRALLVTVSIFRGGDRKDNDGDGWIDEEAQDGRDDDFDRHEDGPDEDTYVGQPYRTTTLIVLPNES